MYQIVGTYNGRSEVIDEFELSDEKEAQRCLREYRIAYGPEWDLKLVRIL